MIKGKSEGRKGKRMYEKNLNKRRGIREKDEEEEEEVN